MVLQDEAQSITLTRKATRRIPTQETIWPTPLSQSQLRESQVGATVVTVVGETDVSGESDFTGLAVDLDVVGAAVVVDVDAVVVEVDAVDPPDAVEAPDAVEPPVVVGALVVVASQQCSDSQVSALRNGGEALAVARIRRPIANTEDFISH